MCGICGIYGLVDKSLLKKMTNSMIHRGPDESGFFIDNNIMLGQRRLSIIDLKTGTQPIYNEDKSITVVCNGEIYNYVELRKDLEHSGHSFSTNSDTEVIAHAYEEYGIDFLRYLNGMFAIALWDSNTKQLLLARDRVGIKPLYYTLAQKQLVFGSEIKSMLVYANVQRQVDLDSFHNFINLRYNPGEKTMFKGIFKLLPGHYIICSKKGTRIKKYWDLDIRIKDRGIAAFSKELDKQLETSVKMQLRSDVPIGILLSAGLDSSTITAYASRHCKKLRTYTMGFGEETDECTQAEKISDYFGCVHKNLYIENHFLRDFKKLIWHLDQPKRNLYPYYIYDKLREHVKVVLSGLGGDELLGGYTFRYKYMQNSQKFRKFFPRGGIIKKALRKPARALIKNYVKLNIKQGSIIKDTYLDKLNMLNRIYTNSGTYYLITTADSGFSKEQYTKQIYGKQMLENMNTFHRPFDNYFKDKLSLIDQTYQVEFKEKLPNDFLIVDDSMSMAASVESRVPFLDNKLVDFCFNMPNKYKYNGRLGKLILRKNLSKLMPRRMLLTEKRGFSSNTYTIYKNELRDIAQDELVNGSAVKLGLINPSFIRKIVSTRSNLDKTRYYNFLWNLYAFDTWHSLYFKT